MPRTFVIAGASLAGATAAITLRQEGFDGEILLAGAERFPPYERPALSKQYLRGEIPFDKLLVRPPGFYDEHRITALFGTQITRVRPGDRTVEFQDGGRVRYDRLLVATGARNRRPRIPGMHLPGVFSLRTVPDAEAIRHEAAPGRRAIVVGMGFIGCEVTASLRSMGVEVAAVDTSPAPLFRVLGREVSEIVASIHRDHGVQAFFEEGVAAFEGDERVSGVVTTGGRRIECDFAVVGVGVEPEVDLLAGSGLDIDDGLVVDEYCRSASPDLYAAGDVASQHHPLSGRRFRVEHWQNAMQQGAAAARNMLGREQPYDPVHWFWSDQYDCNLQFAGLRHGSDRLVVRGSLERRDCLGFYVREERVDAIVGLNRGKELRRAMPLVRSRQPVDARRLQDEAVDVRSLVREGVRVSTGAGEQESTQEQESKGPY